MASIEMSPGERKKRLVSMIDAIQREIPDMTQERIAGMVGYANNAISDMLSPKGEVSTKFLRIIEKSFFGKHVEKINPSNGTEGGTGLPGKNDIQVWPKHPLEAVLQDIAKSLRELVTEIKKGEPQ